MPKKRRYIARTQAEVAEFFGRSLNTIMNWAKQGMPGRPPQGKTPGEYDLGEIFRWREERRRNAISERQKAQTAVDQHRAEMMRLKVGKLQGELVDASAMSREMSEWAGKVRNRLLFLIDRIVNVVPGELKVTIKRIVEQTIWTTIRECFSAELLGSTPDEMILAAAADIRQKRAIHERNGHSPKEPPDA